MDVKPANIMVQEHSGQWECTLGDFGAAAEVDRTCPSEYGRISVGRLTKISSLGGWAFGAPIGGTSQTGHNSKLENAFGNYKIGG